MLRKTKKWSIFGRKEMELTKRDLHFSNSREQSYHFSGIWIFPFLYKEVPYAEKKSREGEVCFLGPNYKHCQLAVCQDPV